jgi:hypothetical protein
MAEHALADVRDDLTKILGGPLRDLPRSLETERLGGALVGCLLLRRSIESLLFHAERLVDDRVAGATSYAGPLSASQDGDELLERMHAVMTESLKVLATSVETRAPVDVEAARAREITMNGLDARARAAMLVRGREAEPRRVEADRLDLVDAYEAAGNQAYRLAETLGEAYVPSVVVEAV